MSQVESAEVPREFFLWKWRVMLAISYLVKTRYWVDSTFSLMQNSGRRDQTLYKEPRRSLVRLANFISGTLKIRFIILYVYNIWLRFCFLSLSSFRSPVTESSSLSVVNVITPWRYFPQYFAWYRNRQSAETNLTRISRSVTQNWST